MSFVRGLPNPQHDYAGLRTAASVAGTPAAGPGRAVREPPPYGARRSAGFVPKKPEDFGDGGAFPEIHIPQFPLGMGRPDDAGRSTKVLPALDVTARHSGAGKPQRIHFPLPPSRRCPPLLKYQHSLLFFF